MPRMIGVRSGCCVADLMLGGPSVLDVGRDSEQAREQDGWSCQEVPVSEHLSDHAATARPAERRDPGGRRRRDTSSAGCGGGGIRTPEALTPGRFQGGFLRPLGHASRR